MDAFIFPHLHSDKSTAYFALFRNVENASSLRQRIIKVSTLTNADERAQEERDAVNFAFIDARLVSLRNERSHGNDWTDEYPSMSLLNSLPYILET